MHTRDTIKAYPWKATNTFKVPIERYQIEGWKNGKLAPSHAFNA